MKLFKYKPGQRNHLLLVAVHHFPSGLFKTSIGVTLLATPYILNFLSERGVTSLTERTILNGLVVILTPTILLFILTLVRSPSIRRRSEAVVESERQATVNSLHALEAQERKEEKEIVRLQQVVTTDMKARRVKDAKEEERWGQLNERLRVQEETGQHNNDLKEEREVARQELASEERILVAQQVKDLKDEGDSVRKELVSDRLIAQEVKDKKEDERWGQLNERLRVQEELGQINNDLKEEREVARQELASEERILVAQQVKDLKDEGDSVRKELVSDRLIAQEVKDRKENERWDALNENMRVRQVESRKRSDDLKEEREVVRMKLATGVLKAQQDKNLTDDERWNVLHERINIQELNSERREREQLKRDEELRKLLLSLIPPSK